jgi:very-short-patch-repair endonuclease
LFCTPSGCWGVLVGGGHPRDPANPAMKKHPLDGAHEQARFLRRNMTEAEKRVWQILRSRQMGEYRFRRQVPFGRYIADFVCHEARLIVEVDGGQHNTTSPQEAERTSVLEGEGYRVLRLWNNEVLENPEGVYQAVAARLGGITPTHPSPIEGEGFPGDSR